jgi:hypothetical protein
MKKLLSLVALALVVWPVLTLVGCGGDDDPGTPPTTGCSLEVTHPPAGDDILTGQDLRIRWEQEGNAAVQIDLLKGGAFVATIATVQSRDNFLWRTTTYGQGSGDDFAIRLSAVGEDDCGDTGGEFEITDTMNCNFAFTFPDTAYLDEGQEFLVTWDSESTTGMVDIELCRQDDPEFPVGLVAGNLEDTGEYLWTVDSLHQGTYGFYFLKITDDQVSSCTASSDYFQINDENICEITVNEPQPLAVWAEGETRTVAFSAYDDATEMVNISLYQGLVYVNTIAVQVAVTHNVDSLEWVVDTTGSAAPGHPYRIKVTDAMDSNCVGWSADFTITR